jgi:hypothetical protein
MRRTGPCLGLLLLALLLSACGGGDIEAASPSQVIASAPAAAPVAAPREAPAAQPPGRSASATTDAARKDALAGIDSNRNGVRDDIEKLVTGFDVTPDGRKAVLQLARATQLALTTSTSEEAAQRNGAEMVRAQACLASHIPDFTTYLSAVRAQTLDTDLRRLAWQAFEEQIARLEFTELQGAICQ